MKNKGITLVALVMTIVVLIILAAVAINLSLGNNGIFKRSKEAKEKYQNAELSEQQMINGINLSSFRDNGDILARIQKLEDDNAALSSKVNELTDDLTQATTQIEALENSSDFQTTSLWSGTASNGATVTLSQSYQNFDVLYFYMSYRMNDCYSIFPVITSVISTYGGYNRGVLYTTYDAEYITFKFTSETTVKLSSAGGSNNLLRVVGVKY